MLQHAENPVDWYPWGPPALEKAHSEDKPIFLSIGYAACHWCHVMAHESFEDPAIAELLNQHFINIKVDREERPDIDSIYMQAVVAMTGQGGWPMSVFLTPDGRPFFGGTYFPPTRRHNLPAFREILITIARLWRDERQQLIGSAQQITGYIQSAVNFEPDSGNLPSPSLDDAINLLSRSYDWSNGSWGNAPKFPQPMTIEFLLRRAVRGDTQALQMAVHALQAMAKGGMYDVIGGGFARYSTDNEWLVPHFEKMLYDNAQLTLAYLHAFLITGNESFRMVCEQTLDFVARELQHPEGGFYSSLDADSEGSEGKYYLWSLAEIQSALVDPEDRALALAALTITEAGNFEGKNILRRLLSDEQLAAHFSTSVDHISRQFRLVNEQLLAYRQSKIHPATDDKIIVSWNALMLAAFAEAGRYLKNPDYTQIAIRNGQFLLDHLISNDRLMRSWRAGKAQHMAYLEDYASLILALLSLYQSDPNLVWFTAAEKLAREMIAGFQDPGGGFFDTHRDNPNLIIRPKDLQDNATPSGNALAALALLQLHAYTEDALWKDLAGTCLDLTRSTASRYPTAVAQWRIALDF